MHPARSHRPAIAAPAALSLVLASLLLLLAAPPVRAKKIVVPVTRAFLEGWVAFDDDKGMRLRVGPVDVGGKAAICGVWWTDGKVALYRELGRKVLRKYQWQLAGRPVHVNTSRFLRVDTKGEAVRAGCHVTDIPWHRGIEKSFAGHLSPGMITY